MSPPTKKAACQCGTVFTLFPNSSTTKNSLYTDECIRYYEHVKDGKCKGFKNVVISLGNRQTVELRRTFHDSMRKNGKNTLEHRAKKAKANAEAKHGESDQGSGGEEECGSDTPQPQNVRRPLRTAPKVVVAVLVSGKFTTASVWEAWWQRGDKAAVAFVVHASNQKEKEAADTDEFCERVGGTRVPSIETAWGKISIVEAEMLLFAECARLYGTATHFALVSQNTIPFVSVTKLLEATEGYLQGKTAWRHIKDEDLAPECRGPMRAGFDSMFGEENPELQYGYGQQFMIVNSEHFRGIESDARELIQRYRERMEGWDAVALGAPDELILQSLLLTKYPGALVDMDVVWAEITSAGRAQWQDNKLMSDEIVKIANANKEKMVCFGLRKFKSVFMLMLELLFQWGVIVKYW